MSGKCPSCQSDRCGNHAACARKRVQHDTDEQRRYAWLMIWPIIGLAEAGARKMLSKIGVDLYGGRLVEAVAGEDIRRRAVEQVLILMERQP